MTTLEKTSALGLSAGSSGGFKTFLDEVGIVLGALLNPRKVIEEVEEMRALQVEAGRIEATDPVRAGVLRRKASLVGLR